MIDDGITTEEQYSIATNANNLRVEAEKRSQADILIAAGWSYSRMGMALLRLHSEYDGVEHPALGTKIYLHEMALMLGKLKTLPEVRARLLENVGTWKRKVQAPEDLVADVIMWWLDSVCPVCHGAQRDRAMHNKAICPSCRGSGKRKLPQGEAGRKLANLIDDSLSAARSSIKKRLHQSRKSV